MNFDNWVPHAHYVGLLMSNGRGKSNLEKYNKLVADKKEARAKYDALENKGTIAAGNFLNKAIDCGKQIKLLEPYKDVPLLGATCKQKLHEIYIHLTTGRKKIIESDYLEKGLMVEEDSITAYSQLTGEFHKKNEESKDNGWVTGTMDFSWDDIVIDTKSSWDIWTFSNARFAKILSLYHWQLDCYMWLYGKSKGRLVYCLINTPEHLIRKEETRLMYKLFGSEQNYLMAPDYMKEAYEEAKIEVRRNHIFDDLPLKDKVQIKDVERSEERIEQIKKRIVECRWFLNNIEKADSQEEEVEIAA